MKTAKKIVSVLLAVFMIVAMAVNVGATSGSIEGHTYQAYQIFTGTQAANSTKLGNVGWGTGVTPATLLTEIQKIEIEVEEDGETKTVKPFGNVASSTTAAQVAEILNTYSANDALAKAFAKAAYASKTSTSKAVVSNVTEMDPGYYLVVDNTDLDSLSVNEADAITAYKVRNIAMVRVTENGKLTISNKTSVPSVEKKVKEKNDSAATDAQESGWQDGADYDIGDEVPFQLTATLPTNYADYDRYKLAFHDILSSGLTFKEITTVYALNGTNKTEFAVSDWSKGDGADGDSFAVTFADLKTSSIKDNISDSTKIVVEYTATLNESAVIGATGNPNKVYLEYANNPNNSGTGDIDTSNTPEDKVIVFTYQLKVNKVDEADEALQGAGFTLYKKNGSGTYDLVKAITNDDDIATEFIFTGLDAGSYKLVESKTPAGYNTAEDLLFVVSATYNTSADDPKLSSLTVDNTSLLTDMSTGIITTDVENKAGGTLPTTGGMGTTLFTVCGIVLMLGASILLVTRKRMSK